MVEKLRNELNLLNTRLIALHKGLLDYQIKHSQEQDGRKYNPYELLDKAFKDERFQWLRGLSLLISGIDEQLSVRNLKKPVDPSNILDQVVDLLDGKNKEFVGRYSLALVADPRIAITEVDVRKSISGLRAILNPKKNPHEF
jgi:hypothetical protein